MPFAIAAFVLASWLALLLRGGASWRLRPRESDLAAAPAPCVWPAVRIVVPARNEAGSLPATLPALLAQDYPGEFEVLVVDDRSSDETRGVAAAIAARHAGGQRLRVVHGMALPDGWVGKPWAMAQGVSEPGSFEPGWLLFTDADIEHAPHSLARLVAGALHEGLALDSRMARLRCRSAAERLLMPAYLYFFNLLYPMPRANDPDDRLAAAAGGCVLVDAAALRDAGGLARIGGCLIDDIALARLIKTGGRRIRLALAERSVRSLRVYDDEDAPVWGGDVWRMVRRSAFEQLRHSWPLLALTLVLLAAVFVLPVLLLPMAAVVGVSGNAPGAALAIAGAFGTLAMACSYLPALRYFELPAWRVVTLPWAALLFGCMTLDSALSSRRQRASGWR